MGEKSYNNKQTRLTPYNIHERGALTQYLSLNTSGYFSRDLQ